MTGAPPDPVTRDGLPDDVRALLRDANRALNADAHAAAVWGRLADKLGPAAAEAPLVATAASPRTRLAWSLAAGGAAVALAVAALLTTPTPRAVPASPAFPAPSVREAPRAPEAAPPAAAAPVLAPAAPAAPPVTTSPKRAAPRQVVASPPPARDGLDPAERLLVNAQRRALETGDIAGVHALAAEHAARFPAGALSEESDALDVMAAQRAHAPDAAARTRAFVPRYPASLFRGLIAPPDPRESAMTDADRPKDPLPTKQ